MYHPPKVTVQRCDAVPDGMVDPATGLPVFICLRCEGDPDADHDASHEPDTYCQELDTERFNHCFPHVELDPARSDHKCDYCRIPDAIKALERGWVLGLVALSVLGWDKYSKRDELIKLVDREFDNSCEALGINAVLRDANNKRREEYRKRYIRRYNRDAEPERRDKIREYRDAVYRETHADLNPRWYVLAGAVLGAVARGVEEWRWNASVPFERILRKSPPRGEGAEDEILPHQKKDALHKDLLNQIGLRKSTTPDETPSDESTKHESSPQEGSSEEEITWDKTVTQLPPREVLSLKTDPVRRTVVEEFLFGLELKQRKSIAASTHEGTSHEGSSQEGQSVEKPSDEIPAQEESSIERSSADGNPANLWGILNSHEDTSTESQSKEAQSEEEVYSPGSDISWTMVGGNSPINESLSNVDLLHEIRSDESLLLESLFDEGYGSEDE